MMSSLRSIRFRKLQEREIKLGLIYASDAAPVFTKDAVSLSFPFLENQIKLQLRIDGSDILVFQQIFINHGYREVLEIYHRLFHSTPSHIVDAGANIALASIYFALNCPGARILAIEPDEGNAFAARKNIMLNALDAVNLRRAALWSVPGQLVVMNDFRDGSNWSFRVEENASGNVDALTPSEVINYFDGSIDILKIDIEGGEARLFEDRDALTWLKSVKMIAIEIHHEWVDPSTITDSLRHFGFQVQVSGELTIGTNSSFLK